jgi:regulator of sirC expression with transglutaminase-like and TPR domain
MNLNHVFKQLATAETAPCDLAELALCLAREEYPDVDVEAYLSELNSMAHEARSYLRGTLEARVTGLCRYLFHEMGFRGNIQNYYDPRNSYLNHVLDRRTGIPLTLSMLAMVVGQRAGLTVAGVGLPGHFVAKALDEGQEVLFDPFHGGRQLSADECAILVHQVTGTAFEPSPYNLSAVSLRQLVIRWLSNLRMIYWKQADYLRAVRVLGRLWQLLPGDAELCRDLGISWLNLDRPGRAVDYLTQYLRTTPAGLETVTVCELLNQAMRELGQRN